MKKIKDNLIMVIVILGFCGLIYGIGYVKYNIWRAEHNNSNFSKKKQTSK